MRIRKVIDKRVRSREGGVNVDAGINAVVAANVNEKGPVRTTLSSSRRIVQKSQDEGGPTA